MRTPFTLRLLLITTAALGCRPDGPTTPASPGTTTDLVASRVAEHVSLVVDDDATECPRARYTTIQDAVDAADPGGTILVCAGTYHERVLISGEAKNGLRLLAQGAPDAVVLEGDDPHAAPFPTGTNHGFHLLNVSAVLIQGFTVHRYFENIRLTGATHNTIRQNRTSAGGHDGIFAQNSADNLIEHNVSFDNPSGNACGINVAGAGSVGNVIRHNVVFHNNWGINIQVGPADNVVFGNVAVNNRSHGILNRGSNGTRIEANRVEGNGTGEDPSTLVPGGPRAGIGVQQATVAGAVLVSNNVTVTRNRAFNQFDMVVDLFWDGQGSGNAFLNNHCRSSSPDGLCAHGEGRSH